MARYPASLPVQPRPGTDPVEPGPSDIAPRPGSGGSSKPVKPGPVVRPPPVRPRPVNFKPVSSGRRGLHTAGSGSGGTYQSGMSNTGQVGRRRGMTVQSNPVHPSSRRRMSNFGANISRGSQRGTLPAQPRRSYT